MNYGDAGTFTPPAELGSEKVAAQLREERSRLEEAILFLERLARAAASVAGGPPRWMKEAEERKGSGRPRTSG